MVRLLSRVDVGDCWTWQGAVSSGGYGSTWVDGRAVSPHRAVWQELVGPIPEGLELDHLCRVKLCVNPDHLEPVTRAENLRRNPKQRFNKWTYISITHCINGHAYTNDNTRWQRNGKSRYCMTCNRNRQRNRRARKAQEEK